MRKSSKTFVWAEIFFCLFAVWTLLIKVVDVKGIGPNGSEVGFATLNQKVFETLGTNQLCYNISEFLGYFAILVCAFFGFIGLIQLIKGRGLKGVDNRIIVLGIYYIIVIGLYFAFTKIGLSYRPVLEADGTLEPSYPSSHTMLALCVYGTMFMQRFFQKEGTRRQNAENAVCAVLMCIAMVGTRLLAGVHWATDIIGSILISVAMILLYKAVIDKGEGL